MIRALVLDLGGVLIDLNTDECKKAFVGILNYTRIYDILDSCHQKGIYSDLEEGKITVDEFRAGILAESRPGAAPNDVDRCMEALIVGMNPEKAPFVRELSEKYELYALSNNNPISLRRFHEIFEANGIDYRKVFRKEFISSEMKLLKPGLEIYREVLRQIAIPAEEILFVDDSQSNVDSARAVGMHGVLYVPGTDLRTTVMNAINELAI